MTIRTVEQCDKRITITRAAYWLALDLGNLDQADQASCEIDELLDQRLTLAKQPAHQ